MGGVASVSWEGRCKATWKREFKLPWRKAGLLISMIKWTRTSRLSIQISLSASVSGADPRRFRQVVPVREVMGRREAVAEHDCVLCLDAPRTVPTPYPLQGYLDHKKTPHP